MPTTFPVTLDVFVPKVFDDPIVAAHMNELQDAIDAVETKLGIGSVGGGLGATNTIDYLLRSPSSTDPGHRHTTGAITGSIDEALVQRLSAASLARLAVADTVSANWTFASSGGLAVQAGAGTLSSGVSELVIGSGGAGVNSTTLCFSSIAAGRTFGIGNDFFGPFAATLTVTDLFRVGSVDAVPQCALHVHDFTTQSAFIGVAATSMRLSAEGISDATYLSLTFANVANQLLGKIGVRRIDAGGGRHALYFGVPTTLSTTGIDRIMVFEARPFSGLQLPALGIGDSPKAALYVVSNVKGSDGGPQLRSLTVISHSTGTLGPAFILAKSRGVFGTSSTYPNQSDDLGVIQFCGRVSGFANLGFTTGAQIASVATRNWDPGMATPGRDARLAFLTYPPSGTQPVERIRIRATGEVQIGGDTASATTSNYPVSVGAPLTLPNTVDATKVKLSLWAGNSTPGDQVGFGIDPGYLRCQMALSGYGFRFKHATSVLTTVNGYLQGAALDLNNTSLCLKPHTGLTTGGAAVTGGGTNGVITVGAVTQYNSSGYAGATVIDVSGQSFVTMRNANALFNIHGIKGGRAGQILVLFFDTYNGSTYPNVAIWGESIWEDVPANRIINGGVTSGGFINGGGTLTTDGRCAVMLIYDATFAGGRWCVIMSSAGKAPV